MKWVRLRWISFFADDNDYDISQRQRKYEDNVSEAIVCKPKLNELSMSIDSQTLMLAYHVALSLKNGFFPFKLIIAESLPNTYFVYTKIAFASHLNTKKLRLNLSFIQWSQLCSLLQIIYGF